MSDNLFGKDRRELADLVVSLGHPPFHARQLFAWLYAQRRTEFSAMSNLPRPLRAALAGRYSVSHPNVELRQTSRDGTVKVLLRLSDGMAVESVYIPEKGRTTLCISSQIGCALGCSFCLTAKMGRVRDLSAGEIAGQVAVLASSHRLEPNAYNLVFMGMGEPLLNYDAVLSAFRLLTDPEGFGLSWKHITLSTAGVVPGIRRLAGETSRPRLAVSLSATTDALRNRLMPINRAYPLSELFRALREFPLKPRERVTLEYVLLKGINDTPEDARRLADLAGSIPLKTNLIPYNEAAVEGYAATGAEPAEAFRNILVNRGVRASIRRRRGADISAACGQLAILDPAALARPVSVA